ncbi:MAG: ElyC/SanA/YdcF family protein [Vicinamibacteraceae bacterium]
MTLFPFTFLRSLRASITAFPRRNFLVGVFCGVLATVALRYTINNTTLADLLVGPLIISDTPGSGDAIVVPGAGVSQACSPNVFAVRRVLLARRAFVEGRAPIIVFSGSRPTGLPCAVADVMAALAVQLGVPRDRILVETAATTTWENAQRTDPMLRKLGVRRIVLVTDRLHMMRAEACFEQFGYRVERAAVPTPDSISDNMTMLSMGAREAVALAYYWMEGRFTRATVVHAASREDGPEPQSPTAAPALPSKTPMTSPRFPTGPVVLLGASYAKGWAPTIPGRRLVNKGVEGQQSWELLARFERDVTAEQPRAVVVWGFINDIFRSKPDQMAATMARLQSSMTAMVEAARAQGIEPILATEVTIRGRDTWSDTFGSLVGWLTGKEGYQGYINKHVLAGNQWLRDYAGRERLLLLDLQPAVSDEANWRRKAFANADGSHITPAGYTELSRYAVPRLASHLGAP